MTLADPYYLTVARAAKILDVSEKTIRGLVRDRSLESVRIGRAIRIAPDALHDYLQSASSSSVDGEAR